MINWTTTEIFTDSITGQPFPKWFVSEAAGSRLEWSTHDPTIKEKLPPDFWLPVYASSEKNLRQHVVDGALVYLIGFGSDSDHNGKLMMLRMTIDRLKLAANPEETLGHVAQAGIVVQAMLAPHGFDPDKSMWDSVTAN